MSGINIAALYGKMSEKSIGREKDYFDYGDYLVEFKSLATKVHPVTFAPMFCANFHVVESSLPERVGKSASWTLTGAPLGFGGAEMLAMNLAMLGIDPSSATQDQKNFAELLHNAIHGDADSIAKVNEIPDGHPLASFKKLDFYVGRKVKVSVRPNQKGTFSKFFWKAAS